MGFNPASVMKGNVKVRQQQAFRKKTTSAYSNQETVTPRIVYHYEISPNDTANNGYILGVLNYYGEERHVKITVTDAAYQAQKARDAAKNGKYENNFNGAYIDSRMVSSGKIKVDPKNAENKTQALGLEGAVFHPSKVEKINGIEYIPVSVNRIINIKRLDKAIEGIFTANGYYDRNTESYKVSTIDEWYLNPVSFEDKEEIDKFKKRLENLNELRDRYESGEGSVDMLPNLGFKFIATAVTYGEDKETKERVVVSRDLFNSSSCMDLLQLEDNKYRPLNAEFLDAMIDGYTDYIFNGLDGEKSQVEIAQVNPDDVVLEILAFQAYRVTSVDERNRFSFNTTNEKVKGIPLYQMIQTPYFNALEEDEPSVGRNLAYTGFIKLSKDKVNEETMTKTIQSLVTESFFGNVRGNILSFIRNTDGGKYTVREEIRKRYYTPEERMEIEKRAEEKKLREGNSGLSGSNMNAPSGLGLEEKPKAQ